MTDVLALFGRGALRRAPFRNSNSSACFADKPLKGSDPSLILLEQVSSLSVRVKSACFVLLNPYADQIAADISWRFESP